MSSQSCPVPILQEPVTGSIQPMCPVRSPGSAAGLKSQGAEAPQLAEYARCAATWINRPRTTYMEVAISPMETNGLPSSNRRGIRASSHRCQTQPARPW